jgi:alkanesulfonate monooxygenase SsuD/methylene tetrahydromethanopterin reductase-like flavin-dependent oxidoreductase (luciferase family)
MSTDKPVAVVRDAIRTAADVFAGRTTDLYVAPEHAAPPRTIPQYVGARGPQLNRLASRMADGVFLSGFDIESALEPIREARSVRPIHVNLCISVRYGGAADEWSIAGDESEVADQLRRAIDRHRPETIGVALVDRDPLPAMIARAIGTLGRLRD